MSGKRISRENYREILWPLPAREMFFVGKVTAQKLTSAGINTIGDIAVTNPDVLEGMLGKQGRQLWEYTNGLDESPVARVGEGEKIKSVGNGITFSRDLVTEDDIVTAVTSLSDTVAGRLRKYGMKACGVKVDIKDPYFKVISRQKQFFTPTNLACELANSAIDIIHSSWKKGSPIRMLTITGINLTDEIFDEQLSIFGGDSISRKKGEQIERTMDEVRKKYGSASIGFAAVIDNDIGAFVRSYEEEEGCGSKKRKE